MAVGELNSKEKTRVNAAVSQAEKETGIEFCVILGARADRDPRRAAEAVFHRLNMHTRPGVMLTVSPAGRSIEIVTAPSITTRVSDESCAEAVHLMSRSFAAGDLASGVIDGIELLADKAGPGTSTGEDLPNVVDLDEETPIS